MGQYGDRLRMEKWNSYVDSPEFFDGIKGDDLFEQIIPILVLVNY